MCKIKEGCRAVKMEVQTVKMLTGSLWLDLLKWCGSRQHFSFCGWNACIALPTGQLCSLCPNQDNAIDPCVKSIGNVCRSLFIMLIPGSLTTRDNVKATVDKGICGGSTENVGQC